MSTETEPQVTRCPHTCTAPACLLEPWQCHERHAGEAWIYDPAACERERAAANGRLSVAYGPAEPITDDCDGAPRT